MVLGRSIVSSEFSKTASKVSGHSDHSTVPRVFGWCEEGQGFFFDASPIAGNIYIMISRDGPLPENLLGNQFVSLAFSGQLPNVTCYIPCCNISFLGHWLLRCFHVLFLCEALADLFDRPEAHKDLTTHPHYWHHLCLNNLQAGLQGWGSWETKMFHALIVLLIVACDEFMQIFSDGRFLKQMPNGVSRAAKFGRLLRWRDCFMKCNTRPLSTCMTTKSLVRGVMLWEGLQTTKQYCVNSFEGNSSFMKVLHLLWHRRSEFPTHKSPKWEAICCRLYLCLHWRTLTAFCWDQIRNYCNRFANFGDSNLVLRTVVVWGFDEKIEVESPRSCAWAAPISKWQLKPLDWGFAHWNFREFLLMCCS